jgi:hypothetical protein
VLLESSLARLADMIENLKISLEEFKDISYLDFIKDESRFIDLKTELSRERDTIGLVLGSAKDLSDKIKLTHPSFKSDRLLEYNNFYISSKLDIDYLFLYFDY